MSANPDTTVIVGASAAGLATAACLQRLGQPYVLLEASRNVGNSWRHHYHRLHLHTAKGLSGLPYLAFPREAPKYPSREQVIAYLESYAKELGIAPHLGERVTGIRREGEKWLVHSETAKWPARNVVVATGFARVPERPTWPGLDGFAGRVLHSSGYRSGAEFKDQRVLVVGFGNSGGEIAIDLCEQGAHPSLAVRSAVNVLPRDFLGLPILAWGLMLSLLPDRLGDAIGRLVARLTFGRLDKLGLRPLPYGPMTQIRRYGRIPLLDVGTIARVRSREIEVLPGVSAFTPSGARFLDGSEHAFDGVVLATGFRPAVGEIVDAPGVLDPRGVPLQSGQETLPGLYFCGFNVVATGMLREIAHEARQIARSIASRS